MTSLIEMHCTRPKEGEGLSPQEIEKYATHVPDWEVQNKDGVARLVRHFRFKNFSQALAFSIEVGIIAEKEDHHPAIMTEWGRVTVTFWTHFINGLHLNDFIAAAHTDQLISEG